MTSRSRPDKVDKSVDPSADLHNEKPAYPGGVRQGFGDEARRYQEKLKTRRSYNFQPDGHQCSGSGSRENDALVTVSIPPFSDSVPSSC